MANTFFKAEGLNVGDSLVEDGKLDEARRIQQLARERGVRFVLPVDAAIGDAFPKDAQTIVHAQVVPVDQVPDGWRILDIGPQTISAFDEALSSAQTVIFNGTMGVAEVPEFAKGTNAVIDALVKRSQAGATVIIGGGDSAAAVEAADAVDKVTHVSTGGGASLEFLEGKTLPGVAALCDKGA